MPSNFDQQCLQKPFGGTTKPQVFIMISVKHLRWSKIALYKNNGTINNNNVIY